MCELSSVYHTFIYTHFRMTYTHFGDDIHTFQDDIHTFRSGNGGIACVAAFRYQVYYQVIIKFSFKENSESFF